VTAPSKHCQKKTYKYLYDDLEHNTVSHHVHYFWFKKTILTYDKIFTVFSEEDSLPQEFLTFLSSSTTRHLNVP